MLSTKWRVRTYEHTSAYGTESVDNLVAKAHALLDTAVLLSRNGAPSEVVFNEVMELNKTLDLIRRRL